MEKLEHLYTRSDGSEVKVVATAYYGYGLQLSIGVDVFRRIGGSENWCLTSDRPHPNWRQMSVDEYIKNGRPEKLLVASHGEILKAANALRENIASSAAQEGKA